MVEHYYDEKNENMAVLVSPGYGAGWSTWSDCGIDFATDKRIIEFFIKNEEKIHEYKFDEFPYYDDETAEQYSSIIDEFSKFLESIGYDEGYLGGLCDLVIQWIPIGSMFYIHEYDGSEAIVILKENENYYIAN